MAVDPNCRQCRESSSVDGCVLHATMRPDTPRPTPTPHPSHEFVCSLCGYKNWSKVAGEPCRGYNPNECDEGVKAEVGAMPDAESRSAGSTLVSSAPSQRPTPTPDAVTPFEQLHRKAVDERERRPWAFYRLEYENLRETCDRLLKRAEAAEARCAEQQAENERQRSSLWKMLKFMGNEFGNPAIEDEDEGRIGLDYDLDRHAVVSLTIYPNGRVGWSALVGEIRSHGQFDAHAEHVPRELQQAQQALMVAVRDARPARGE